MAPPPVGVKAMDIQTLGAVAQLPTLVPFDAEADSCADGTLVGLQNIQVIVKNGFQDHPTRSMMRVDVDSSETSRAA